MALALANKTNLPQSGGMKGYATDKASEPMMGATGMSTQQNKRQAGVIEMLEYVKGLDIDPIKESDMLWIAEEAFNAPLPPNWSEHFDDQGRVYFHNAATGESAWQHPMDEMFRQIVEYYRRVRREGGFWYVEDEIAELEENIREGLSDWMELFDEHGEKFYYNRSTAESTFDDPRVAVYHNLYARIKMVAKMKEHLPLLARAPRPEDPTPQELELRRRQEEEEKKYIRCVLRVQAMARVLVARRKMRQMQQKSLVARGHQPLKGKLRLRLETKNPGGTKELVLSQTTPHRRAKAATKIQTRIRGVMARKRFKPMLLHHMYQSKKMVPIQSWARCWLARRKVAAIRHNKQIHAVQNMQRSFRGYKDRQYVATLKAEKHRFEWMMICIVKIQAGVRAALSYKEKEKRKMSRYGANTLVIQGLIRTFLSQRDFLRRQMLERPIQSSFSVNMGEDGILTPWSWRVQMAPLSEEGVWLPEPYGVVDLFEGTGSHEHAVKAVCYIQRCARGMFGRLRVKRRLAMGREIVNSCIDAVFHEHEVREKGCVKIQAQARGLQIRKHDFKKQKFLERMQRSLPTIKLIQAQVHRFLAQEWMISQLAVRRQNEAGIIIQKHWRGWMARRHCEALLEQSLWPLKGWFEYTPTGPSTVAVEVRFLPNPSFDDYRYFVEHGSAEDLNLSLEEMQLEVALCVDQYLAERGMRPMSASEEKHKIAKKAAPEFTPFLSSVEDLPAFPDKMPDGGLLMDDYADNPLMQQQLRDQERVAQKMAELEQPDEPRSSAMLDSVAGLDFSGLFDAGAADEGLQKEVPPMQSFVMQSEVGDVEPEVAQKVEPVVPQKVSAEIAQKIADSDPMMMAQKDSAEIAQKIAEHPMMMVESPAVVEALPEALPVVKEETQAVVEAAPVTKEQTPPVAEASPLQSSAQEPPAVTESSPQEQEQAAAAVVEASLIATKLAEAEATMAPSDPEATPRKPSNQDSPDAALHAVQPEKEASIKPVEELKPLKEVVSRPSSRAGSRTGSRRPSGEPDAHSATSEGFANTFLTTKSSLAAAPDHSSEARRMSGERQEQPALNQTGDIFGASQSSLLVAAPEQGSELVLGNSLGMQGMSSLGMQGMQVDPFRETMKTSSTGGLTAQGWVPAEAKHKAPAPAQLQHPAKSQPQAAPQHPAKASPLEPLPQAPVAKAHGSKDAEGRASSKKAAKKQAERGSQFVDTYKQEQKKDAGAQQRKAKPAQPPMDTRAHEVLHRQANQVSAPPDQVSAPGKSPPHSERKHHPQDMPPRPPQQVGAPAPPGPGGLSGVRDVNAIDIRSTSARTGQGDIDDGSGLPPVRPPSRNMTQAPPPEPVPDHQSYGGKFVGGKFYKNHISNIDELSKDEQQKIMQDLEQRRKEKIEELAARQRRHEQNRKKQEMQEKKKYQMQQSSSAPSLPQDPGSDERSKKVGELKKWLQKKEDESRKKREAEQKAMQELLDREKKKAERREETEKARLVERERRLKVADRRKAELEQAMGMQGRPAPSAASGDQAAGSSNDPRNVMHKHIHHHIHYHQEGEEGEEGTAMHSSDDQYESGEERNALSLEERRRIEHESEMTIRQQLPADAGMMGQSISGSSAAGYAPSVGEQSSDMARTIESFAPHVNAALRRSHSESAMPRPNPGAQRYAANVQRAQGAYADPGRPRYGAR